MKKFTYLATALLVLAGAAGCKKNSDVQEPEQQSSGRMIPFTVTAGQGGQKTSMVDGVGLAWTAGDKITVLKQDGTCSTSLTLSDGAGSASGTFSGEISADVHDGAALYGMYKATYNAGNFSVNVPTSQTYNATSFQEGIFPSIGTGTYKTDGSTSISLSNPMGILRVNLKGTATVTQVKITAATSNIAGNFNVTSAMAVSDGSDNSKSITINCSEAVTLTSKGVYFNFVTAPFEEQSLTLVVTFSDATTFNASITADVTASNATKQDVIVCSGPKPGTTGTASRTGGTAGWVQLWDGGPKWAVENVGSDTGEGSYGCGGYYYWKGNVSREKKSETVDDTATDIWGSKWRMPTSGELEALISTSNTTSTWVDDYNSTGKAGMVYTGKGEYACNSVFFPAAGMYDDDIINGPGVAGYYWSSSLYGGGLAFNLFFISAEGWEDQMIDYNMFYWGNTVRAVLAE